MIDGSVVPDDYKPGRAGPVAASGPESVMRGAWLSIHRQNCRRSGRDRYLFEIPWVFVG